MHQGWPDSPRTFPASDHRAPPDLFALPSRLVERGGPAPSEHELLLAWLDRTDAMVSSGQVSLAAVVGFWRSLGPDYLAGALQGHALAKPYGYAGDFEMMDKIYRHQVSSDPRFRGWDLFFHQQPATCAVRNRAPTFASLMQQSLARLRRPLRVLDVGCGPAHHLAGWLIANPSASVEILCIDHDTRALERAAQVCRPAGHRVRFEHANALRFAPRDTYDVIWSSGLFDYLPDATFTRLASRLHAALRAGGEMVLGNFAPDHPSRSYMELVADWPLRYRDERDLLRLGARCGASPGKARVGREGTGVNLFLHIRAERGA